MNNKLRLGARLHVIRLSRLAAFGIVAFGIVAAGCAATKPPLGEVGELLDYEYVIGPGDTINIFVWNNPEVSTSVPVRPDGRVSAPLVEEVFASGKTPTQLARDLEESISLYIKDPLVTVMVDGFQGRFDQQIRIVGEAVNPSAIPYRQDMTLLDVIIAVGGLTEFASGNKAVLVRYIDGKPVSGGVRIDDLIQDGDISANVAMRPGDILLIPEAWF